jgi:hypothetical protein
MYFKVEILANSEFKSTSLAIRDNIFITGKAFPSEKYGRALAFGKERGRGAV